MTVNIGLNISAIKAQRRLGEATSTLTRSYERLSSGQRINRASDDAAGLAIADSLKAKSRIYTRAVQNINDGLSLIAIADSAISALSEITSRILELAEQSANGTYSNKQREAMDGEAQALAEEYSRITRSTSFNGLKLFDGSMQGLSIQAGFGNEGVLSSSLGGRIGTGQFDPKIDLGTGAGSIPSFVSAGDLNRDGVADVVSANAIGTLSVLIGNGDGTFRPSSDFSTGFTSYSVSPGDVNGDGVLDLVSANYLLSGSVSVLIGNGDGTFKEKADFETGSRPYYVSLGDVNGDGALDAVSANAASHTISVLLGNGDGTFRARADFGTGFSPYSVSLSDLNRDGLLDLVSADGFSASVSVLLGNGDGSFKARASFGAGPSPGSASLGDLNGDGIHDIVASNGSTASVLLGNGDGTFRARTTYSASSGLLSASLGDLNGDSALDIVTVGSSNNASVLLGNGDGTFAAKTDFATGSSPSSVALSDLDGDGVLDLVSSNKNGDSLSVLLARTRDGASPLLPFSLKSKSDALQSLGPLERKLRSLSIQRGVIGSFQARLGTAAISLGTMTESSRIAESRIRDADLGHEAAQLTRTQIVQRAAAAVLAQANQQPQIALSLLGE